MTWAEVIRKLKAAGFVEARSGEGSHLLLKHPGSGKESLGGRSHQEGRRTCAIRTVLAAYLEADPDSRPDARVRVARFSTTARTKLDIVGPAALVGAHRSTMKARASRANGRLGGRPPKNATTRRARPKASR